MLLDQGLDTTRVILLKEVNVRVFDQSTKIAHIAKDEAEREKYVVFT